jgi:hypothetical protein
MKPKTKGGEILKNRRKSALARLEQQLLSGVKRSKGSSVAVTELTESDIKRINNEILTLKSRI